MSARLPSHLYATRTITTDLDEPLQHTLWNLIAFLGQSSGVASLDYLQVFDLNKIDNADFSQLIIHRQEVPLYQATYRTRVPRPVTAKIYVVLDPEGDMATMMFAKEY